MIRSGALVLALAILVRADTKLPEGRRLKVRLAGGESRSYTVELEVGQALVCVGMQRGIDFVLRVDAPGSPRVLEVDSPNHILGPEYLHFVARVAGLHRLEINVPPQGDSRGNAELRCDAPRPATAADRDHAAGSSALFAGVRALAARRADLVGTARIAFEDAVRYFETRSFEQAVARTRLARLQGTLGQRQEALATAAAALAVFERLGQRSSSLAVEQIMAGQHRDLGRHEQAIHHYQRAANLAHAIHDPRSEGVMHMEIAVSLYSLGQYAQAQMRLERSLVLHRQAGNRLSEALSLSTLGMVLRARGRFHEAMSRSQEALTGLRAIGNLSQLPTILNSLGNLNLVVGRYEQAVRNFSEGLKIADTENNERLAFVIRANLGNTYQSLHQYDLAIRYLREALAGARRRNERTVERAVLAGLGRALRATGQREEALRMLDGALELAVSAKDRQGEAHVRNLRAQIYYDQGRPDLTSSELDLALAINLAIGDRRAEAQTLCEIGQLRGPKREALDPLNRCLLTSRSLGDLPTEALALAGLMNTWNALGQPGQAAFFGKESVNRLQELRANVQGLGNDAQQSFTEGKASTYRDLAAILIAQGRLAEARQVLDLLKEEEYFGFLRRDPTAASSVDRRATLNEIESDAQRRYSEIASGLAQRSAERGQLLARSNRNPAEEARIAALDKDLESANGAFQSFLDELGKTFAAKPVAARVEQLRDSQALMEDLRQLPAGTVAIYTLLTSSRLHTILVTPDLQRAYDSPVDAQELNRAVLDFRLAIEQPRSDPKPAAQKLYRLLIAPELDRDLAQSGARTLMWSLDGILRYIPVAALHDGQRYLVERYAMSVFTPASHARLKDLPKPNWRAAGFGVTRPVDGFKPLPAVGSELRGVIHVEGSAPGGVLPGTIQLDQNFTRDALSGLRQAFPVVHIASHFHFQPGSGAESFLLMGDGSRLSLADLRRSVNLFGQVDLLTLSACNTGMGDSQSDGKEVESFGVLAQRLGAKSVMATLWPVADESTSRFMQAFYQHSRQGVSKAEALRRAQIEMMSDGLLIPSGPVRALIHRLEIPANANWSHPYFWAPFFLIGNWL